MTTLWRKTHGDKTYEVRSAGATLRLYTNGAFHSQYNPHRLLTGGVWDLLMLPALCVDATAALVLGVGGGSVIHQLNRTVSAGRIIGVELDPIHLTVARRFFGVDVANVRLIEADATEWIKRHRGHHDVVIDDLFVDARGDPQRPGPVDEAWLELLAARTTATGVLVQNHLSPAIAKHVVSRCADCLKDDFRSALVFTMPRYENGVLALFRTRITARQCRGRIMATIRAVEARAARDLQFSCRQLY